MRLRFWYAALVMSLCHMFTYGQSAPWPPQYKEGGTASDIRGPDGIQYPNWLRAGVQEGIPVVPAVIDLTTLQPNTDIADDLEAAILQAGTAGGGAILLGSGTFDISRTIVLDQDGVVIRGQGQGQTILRYTHSISAGEIRQISPEPGDPAIGDQWL